MFVASAFLLSAFAVPIGELPVAGDRYPRAYFFRGAESSAANPKITYEQWEKSFERLMGIEGKVLDEEVPGRSVRNIEFFTRFKQRHPSQLVMLHFNGNARDPRWQSGEFFAGHFLYYEGSAVTADVPATSGESTIAVGNAKLYRTGIGRYRNSSEDVVICVLKANNQPDWFQCEQVQLISTDLKAGTLRVKRAAFGTRPLAFQAGKAYAAPHRYEGPWGNSSNLMWDHNYSTHCPRDAKGRNLIDVLVEDVARRFLPGGELAAFDGLEFDVLHHQLPPPATRGIDSDGDGRPDNGIIGGINTYGAGVVEFCRRLREKMGPGKFILADGMGVGNQRAFGILNGIESEGFPHLRDLEMKDWSGGLNRHFFWAVNAHAPAFNYINHKFNQPDPATGLPVTPDLPFSTHRTVMAAAVFTDAAVCYSLGPKHAEGELIGIWDELIMGEERKLAWLGRPLGPPVRLAKKSPNLLRGAPESKRVVVEGPDLFVTVTASAAPMTGYPKEMARMMWVSAAGQKFMAWVNEREFESGFYFRDLKPGPVEIEISVEGSEPYRISKMTAHAAADVIYREFEHGLVMANPAPRPHEFDLDKLFPSKSWRRLRGTSLQDPRTNNGSPVSGKLTLGPKDALFLVRR